MFKKIQTKIMLTVSVFIAIILIAVSSITYFQTKQEILSSVDQISKEQVEDVKSRMDLYLSFYGKAVEQYSQDNRILSYLQKLKSNEKESLEKYWPSVANDFEHFTKLNQNVAVIYVGAETKQFQTTPLIDLPDDFDPTERPWYAAALDSPEKAVWTEPYQDASTGEYVVTVVKPVVDPISSEVLGVVGLDLNLAGLTEMINSLKIGYEGYAFLLDKEGIALVHPEEQGNSLSEKAYIETINSSQSGDTSFKEKNTDHDMYYHTLDQTGWKVGVVYETNKLLSNAENLRNLTLIIATISVIASLVLTYLLSRSIAKPITQLNKQVQEVAMGDLTINTEAKSKDEIGQLTYHFNEMVQNMRNLISAVHHSIGNVNDSANNLTAVAEETIASSEEVAKAIGEVAIGATQQAQDSEVANDRTLSLSNQFEIINHKVLEMENLSKQAETTNQNGLAQMNNLRDRTKESSEVVTKVGGVIDNLATQVKEIEQVIHSITEISEQTNLLALNASIEAARAGESGRGFAVVAEEVRKLAEQSAFAAQQVKTTISTIDNETKIVVKEMEQTVAISQLQNETVNHTESAFTEISQTMKAIVSSIEQITKEVESTNVMKDDVVASIQNITSVSEETAAATEEVSASTDEQVRALSTVTQSAIELNESSSKLSEMIKHFKI
ncbi:methyl-accepting chemotaxis protein [Bacillus spongiae]|uniref:Methyl-accepting chemotaxis protein n=2 Tax=Bacillus spongiae TaxID=2683610 RepID=A0ABU8H9H3_9BACI